MTYIGETHVKKIARIAYWNRVEAFTGDLFHTRKHVFLASSEAGDAGVLFSMGVPWSRMLAVDLDVNACARARDKWPNLRVEHAAVDDVIANWEGACPPASVYLDFCAQRNAKLDVVIRRCMKSKFMSEETLFGINLLKGRETGEYRAALHDWKRISGNIRSRGGAQRRREAPRHAEHDFVLTDSDVGAIARHVGLYSDVFFAENVTALLNVITYRTDSPMTIGLYGPRAWIKCRHPLVKNTFFSVVDPVNKKDIRDLALQGDEGDACNLLNIGPGTLRAWKAHKSRGTYRETH